MHNEGNYKQGEKTTLRMEENNNNNKKKTQKIIKLQNSQAAHVAQYQKNKQSNQKVGRRLKQIFLQRSHR